VLVCRQRTGSGEIRPSLPWSERRTRCCCTAPPFTRRAGQVRADLRYSAGGMPCAARKALPFECQGLPAGRPRMHWALIGAVLVARHGASRDGFAPPATPQGR
jgi:hypothetical protein